MAKPMIEGYNSIKTVPKNWATMFGSKNPDDIKNMFLSITAYSSPSINYLSTDVSNVYKFDKTSKFVGGYRFYFPRDNIQENIKHVYSESSSKFGEALMEVRGGLTKNMASAIQAVQSTTQGVLNEEPHIYNKSERRTFSLNIPLIAYSDLDKDIYDITRFFRRLSYPRKAKDAFSNNLVNTIEYPHVFKLRGGLFDTNQPTVDGKYGSYFVLEDFTVDYSPDVKMFIEGYPMQAMLSLSFTELNLVFGDDFDTDRVNVSVAVSGGNGGSKAKGVVSDPQDHLSSINNMTKTSTNAVKEASPDVSSINNMTKTSTNAVKVIPGDVSSINTSLVDSVTEYVKTSQLARRIASVPTSKEEILTVLRSEAEKMIKSSELYKKITAITDIDPIHLREVKSILRKLKF